MYEQHEIDSAGLIYVFIFVHKRGRDFERELGTWTRLKRSDVDIGDMEFLIKLIFRRELES